MTIFCKDCKYNDAYNRCTHEEAKNMITGGPESCSLMRSLSDKCTTAANWFKKKIHLHIKKEYPNSKISHIPEKTEGADVRIYPYDEVDFSILNPDADPEEFGQYAPFADVSIVHGRQTRHTRFGEVYTTYALGVTIDDITESQDSALSSQLYSLAWCQIQAASNRGDVIIRHYPEITRDLPNTLIVYMRYYVR